MADRQRIWAAKRNLKDSSIYVQEDYPKETERKRALLLPILKVAKSITEYDGGCYLAGDKIVVNKKKYGVENIDELPANINPRVTSTRLIGETTYFFSRFSPLSNHFLVPIKLDTTTFNCTEQCYFAAKADYLNDPIHKAEIMQEEDPVKVLHAGKKIVNNSGKNWADVEEEVMLNINREKFRQNAGVRIALMATKNTKLAEANPHDSHWGIGLSIQSEAKEPSPTWGKNIFGQILSTIRSEIKQKEDEQMQH
jgi:hypothetical protein